MIPFSEFDTEPFDSQGPAGGERPTTHASLSGVDVAGLSHPGRVRSTNEDHFLIARFGRFLETVSSNLPAQDLEPLYAETGLGLITADGMGGHAAGDEASRMAINILMNLVLATSDWVLRLDEEADAQRVMQRARERFEKTSEAMTQEADLHPQLHGFGTTLTLAMSLGRNLFLAHVGDSRAYLLRDGDLHQLTRDHTSAQRLVDLGLIEEEDLATHRWRNRLTKLLGDHVNDCRPDVQRLTLESGDTLLLCTDGLSDMVPDDTIARILGDNLSLPETCQHLIDGALNAGGKDNVTVIVARYNSDKDSGD